MNFSLKNIHLLDREYIQDWLYDLEREVTLFIFGSIFLYVAAGTFIWLNAGHASFAAAGILEVVISVFSGLFAGMLVNTITKVFYEEFVYEPEDSELQAQ